MGSIVAWIISAMTRGNIIEGHDLQDMENKIWRTKYAWHVMLNYNSIIWYTKLSEMYCMTLARRTSYILFCSSDGVMSTLGNSSFWVMFVWGGGGDLASAHSLLQNFSSVRMKILIIIKVKILVLIKWSYMSPNQLTIESRMIIICRTSTPISFEHISFWCRFLNPHLTTYHSNKHIYLMPPPHRTLANNQRLP